MAIRGSAAQEYSCGKEDDAEQQSVRMVLKKAPRDARGCCREEIYEEWYRYGDSNPGPVAENHVS